MSSYIQEDLHLAAEVSTELARSRIQYDEDNENNNYDDELDSSDVDETTSLLPSDTGSSSYPTAAAIKPGDANLNYEATDSGAASSRTARAESDDLDDDQEEEEEAEDGIQLKQEFQHLPWSKRPSALLLMVIMLTVILGSTSSATSQMDALVFLICKDYYKALEAVSPVSSSAVSALTAAVTGPPLSLTDPRCVAPEVMADVGLFQTYMTTISAVLSVFTVPFWSSYSDRVGRRPIMMLAMACVILSDLLVILCFLKPEVFNYRWLMMMGVVDGMVGSTSILIIMCSSYISDCIKEAYRAGVLSVFDAWVYAGIALGPLVGSLILELMNRNLMSLFGFALIVHVAVALVILLILPESRSEQSRRKSIGQHLARHRSFLDEQRSRRMSSAAESVADSEQPASMWTKVGATEKLRELLHRANVLEPLKVLRFSYLPDKRARTNMYILIIAQATMGEAISASMTFMLLYAKSRFNFTSVENNYFISLLGSSRFIILSTVFPQILKLARNRWPHSTTRIDYIDKRIIQMGVLFSTLGLLIMAEAPTGAIFLSSVVVMSLGSGTSPLIRNGIIKHAPKNKVGEVLGAANVLAKAEGIVTPMVFATIYNCTIKYRAQAVCETVVAIELLMFLAMSCLYVESKIPSIDDVESMVQ